MSIHSYQINQLSFHLHWKGQKHSLPKGRGIIGCQQDGVLHVFDPIEIASFEESWSLLLGYERAYGWLTLSRIRGSADLCVNGQRLNSNHLVIKESSFMVPACKHTPVDLFLTESASDCHETSLVHSFACSEDGLSETHFNKARLPKESLNTQRFQALDQNCFGEYGIKGIDGQLVEITQSYRFGAVAFEITDGECWVFVDDGLLRVNGFQRIASQIFVGDQVQWQDHCWHIVGESTQKRLEAQVQEFCLHSEIASPLAQEDHLFPIFENATLCDEIPSITMKPEVLADDMVEFRKKLSLWLKSPSSLNQLDTPGLYHPMDQYQSNSKNTSSLHGVSQLALLRLGRKNHFWRQLSVENIELGQPCPQPVPPIKERGRPFMFSMPTLSIKTLSRAILYGTLVIAVVGFLSLVVSVFLF